MKYGNICSEALHGHPKTMSRKTTEKKEFRLFRVKEFLHDH